MLGHLDGPKGISVRLRVGAHQGAVRTSESFNILIPGSLTPKGLHEILQLRPRVLSAGTGFGPRVAQRPGMLRQWAHWENVTLPCFASKTCRCALGLYYTGVHLDRHLDTLSTGVVRVTGEPSGVLRQNLIRNSCSLPSKRIPQFCMVGASSFMFENTKSSSVLLLLFKSFLPTLRNLLIL